MHWNNLFSDIFKEKNNFSGSLSSLFLYMPKCVYVYRVRGGAIMLCKSFSCFHFWRSAWGSYCTTKQTLQVKLAWIPKFWFHGNIFCHIPELAASFYNHIPIKHLKSVNSSQRWSFCYFSNAKSQNIQKYFSCPTWIQIRLAKSIQLSNKVWEAVLYVIWQRIFCWLKLWAYTLLYMGDVLSQLFWAAEESAYDLHLIKSKSEIKGISLVISNQTFGLTKNMWVLVSKARGKNFACSSIEAPL